MTLSYNWLHEYLPVQLEPQRLSAILTAIGLEVEGLKNYSTVPGTLKGLVTGVILDSQNHPNAEKLLITQVDLGPDGVLQIVCGAPNVKVGQKVVVAPAGTTIFPFNSAPITITVTNIRGVESQGMICAEDEIGMSQVHDGILVLPDDCQPGIPVSEYFKPYEDIIFEIGLTPNRMDAMSHLGVARDLCAYLSYHEKPVKPNTPFKNQFVPDDTNSPLIVGIENTHGCQRYSGVTISGLNIKPSPPWLQNKLKAIGLRRINNIVDITNFVLHETGQPLHAFDADAITSGKVIIRNLPEGTPFITLDERERKLSAQDLMICNGEEPMCIAGVFGGLKSGVINSTSNIFLESAWFNPVDIRKTSLRHNLRTDAAMRFEKGVDISNTANVLKRAALLIRNIAGGVITSGIIDVYPQPRPRTELTLKYQYLKKLSGKSYNPDSTRNILASLGFEITRDEVDEISVKVPYSKTDISIPADLVEEILRIDGLDNVDIPSTITITPAVGESKKPHFKEKIAGHLAAAGFNEIMTNSITNSAYFPDDVLSTTVKMVNSLSAGLNVMRPSMLETGLQAIAFNLNRQNHDLRFYEFGKTYHTSGTGNYVERDHLCLYITGNKSEDSWRSKSPKADFYFMKGIVEGLLQLLDVQNPVFTPSENEQVTPGLQGSLHENMIFQAGAVSNKILERFDIKQPVLFADLFWDVLVDYASAAGMRFTELPRQLPVQRDLAMVIPSSLPYSAVEKTIRKINLEKLQSMRLFDVFESQKLGAGKKSMAVSFTFLDEEKTLNEKEIDTMMNRIMATLENELQAEIRKS